MEKNTVITLRIEALTSEGLGVGHAEGMAFFVKDTVPGDTVRAKIVKLKKTYGYARLEQVLEPGEGRTQPACSCARACGGCQLQMLSYPAQLCYKEDKVRNALSRIGGFEEAPNLILPILGMESEGGADAGEASGLHGPRRYRNKAQFPVGTGPDGQPVAGFYAGRTHSIIPQTDCMLGFEENRQILEIILEHMRQCGMTAYDEKSRKGLLRHVMTRKGYATGQLMVCLVLNGSRVPEEERLVEKLSRIPGMTSVVTNINRADTNVIMGEPGRCLYGKPYIEDTIGDVRYRISARSFFQVNPVQTEKLYRTVLDYAGLDGSQTVWDLYCGIGTISLFLASKARQVYGVEIIPEAVRDAEENARLNGIENAAFFAGKAEEVIPQLYEKERIRADVMVVDPPRKGCERILLDTMLSMRPERIVYVSCDPATLARDLKILCEKDYALKKVQPCDMFPDTVHVETVCLLTYS